MASGLLGKRINPYIWCVVGGILGFLIGKKGIEDPKQSMIENVLVGVFGAFIGGDLIVSQLNHGVVDDKVFKFTSLIWAIGGSVGMLMLLRVLRNVVGPMRSGVSKKDKY